jgi:hypothetical protein
MEAWRDTSSPDWVIRWGTEGEPRWLERELGLLEDGYEQRNLGVWLNFIEPLYGETKSLAVYEFEEAGTARVEIVVWGEITNNIWAQGYWKGDA